MNTEGPPAVNGRDVPLFRKTTRLADSTFKRSGGAKTKKRENSLIFKMHLEDMQKHPCKLCEKKFKSASVLERHMLSHTQEKQFACEICGVKFTQKSNRDTHEQWVCGKEKLACTICGKFISGPTNLQHHITKTHKLAPQVECKICGTFMRGDYNRHKKTKMHIKAVEDARVFKQDEEQYRKEKAEALAQLLQALE